MPPSFGPVLGTVTEFIDWSLTIVSIMIIWYVIKFFIVKPPTEDEKKAKDQEWAERGGKMRQLLGEKADERKKREKASETKLKEQVESGRKRDLVSPIKDHVIKASKAISEVQNYLSDLDAKKSKDIISDVKKHVKKAVRRSQELLANVEGKDRGEVEDIIKWLHSLQEGFLNNVIADIPKKIKKASDIKGVLKKFDDVRGSLGNIFEHLEKFHKK